MTLKAPQRLLVTLCPASGVHEEKLRLHVLTSLYDSSLLSYEIKILYLAGNQKKLCRAVSV